ncbi:hypothetical protein FH972_023135 [Carpinus fangiana]|uniref:Tubulin-specific chaperone A n=1 Tax=Carpinus fangiana TaxID=176857 RepID=A0A5N6KWK8_9ROSI|nr:hypothetical protein FH972_023135 [Carpinus fangiana]
MPPPSKLAIVTSSVARLMKDKQSYQKELEEQEERIKKLENETSEDENAGYLLKQERGNLEETKRMIPDLQKRIVDASKKLEQQLVRRKLLSSYIDFANCAELVR